MHHQIGAVATGGDHRTDGDATVADIATRHAHLTRARPLVAYAELVLRDQGIRQLRLQHIAVSGDDADPQTPAVEVGRIAVGDADPAVDDLRRRIDQVFGKGDAGGHIGDHRRRALGNASRRAEQLVEHTVGVGGTSLLVVTLPGDDEIFTGQRGDIRNVLGTGRGGVDQACAVDLDARGIKLLHEHIVTAAAQHPTVGAAPGDHEPAAGEGGNAGRSTAGVGRRIGDVVGQNFRTNLVTSRVEALKENRITGFPDRDKPTGGKTRHIGRVLRAAGGCIDRDLGADFAARSIETLRGDALSAGIRAGPDGDKTTCGQCGQLRLELRTGDQGVDGEFSACGTAIRGIALRAHVAETIVIPGDDEPTTGQRHHRGLILVAAGRGIGAEFGTRGHAAGVKTLGVNARATAILAIATPDDDITAVTQARHRGLVLVAQGLTIDLKFRPHRRAAG